MNLYRISQNVNTGYDTYDSAVVVAANEDEARRMHPAEGPPTFDYWDSSTWVSHPTDVKVELIGTAAPHLGRCVVVSSFNAG